MPSTSGKTAYDLLAGGEPITNTRDRIIQKALNLFCQHGYHAIGIDRIIADVGVTKTTFYNHFESRDDLIVQSIKKRSEWDHATWGRMIKERAGDDAREQLIAFFDVLDELLTHPDFKGCLFISAAAEFPSPNDPVHQAAAQYKHDTIKFFSDTATAAGLKNPQDLAQKLMIVCEGAITLHQVTHQDGAASAAKQLAKQLIDQHVA